MVYILCDWFLFIIILVSIKAKGLHQGKSFCRSKETINKTKGNIQKGRCLQMTHLTKSWYLKSTK